MTSLSQKIIKPKLGLLDLAKQLGNVSQACKIMGYSRDTFYRYQELYETGGEEALVEISRKKPIEKNRVPDYIEDAIVNLAIENPALGQQRVANTLQQRGIMVSASGVRCVWLRHNLESFKKRLKALEKHSAETGVVLTEEQLQALEKAKLEKEAHGEIETQHPGYLLSHRGTEYCGKVDEHAYQLYLGIENIDHSKTKARSPQTNGICERYHRTMKEEFYDVAFRKKVYHNLEALQTDVNEWLKLYNQHRPHSGKYCYGKTPMQTFIEGKALAREKQLDSVFELNHTDMDLPEGANTSTEVIATEGRIAPSDESHQEMNYQGANLSELQKSSDLTDRQTV